MRNRASKLPICSAGLLPLTKTRNEDRACIIIMPRETEAGEELLVIYSEFEEKSQVGWVGGVWCGFDNTRLKREASSRCNNLYTDECNWLL